MLCCGGVMVWGQVVGGFKERVRVYNTLLDDLRYYLKFSLTLNL